MTDKLSEDRIEEELQSVVNNNENRDLAWAWDTYHEKLAKLKERTPDSVSPKMVQERAISMVRSSSLRNTRSGSVDELDILAIGHGGIQRWNDRDNGGKKDVVISYGIVNPGPDSSGDERPMQLGVFINDETDGVDIGNITDCFQPFNDLKGFYGLNDSDEFTNVYVSNSSDKTRVEKVESDNTDEEKRQVVHNFIEEEAKLDSIANYLSATNEEGYAAEFGADIKRMVVDVVDWNKGDGYNTYTLIDDSVVDPSRLGEEIVSERARSPGLTAWCPDSFHKYGNDSQIEVYGTISRGDNGQITMNVCGVYPIWPMEMETEDTQTAGTSGSTTTSSI
jgi:hypothetical protein